MKNLSPNKANRLRSGQTLFWVEAYVNDQMQFVVEFHEKLLQGKKRIQRAWNTLFLPKPALALFKTRKGEVFELPYWSEAVIKELWFFANRRSALQAVQEINDDRWPELKEVLLKQARGRQRQAEEAAQRNREWEEKYGKGTPNNGQAIRAYGESEIWPTHVSSLPAAALTDILDRNNPPDQHQGIVKKILGETGGKFTFGDFKPKE